MLKQLFKLRGVLSKHMSLSIEISGAILLLAAWSICFNLKLVSTTILPSPL